MEQGTVKWFNDDKVMASLLVKVAMMYLFIFLLFKGMALSH